MRIAYIMICHKNAEQINREIRALSILRSDVQTDFYIFVSKKSFISPDIMKADHVHLIDEDQRFIVGWGVIDFVDAVLTLMRRVIGSGKNYDYIWLVSGQDYPIKSEKEIFRFLAENRGKNFINCMSCDSDLYRRFLKRNMLFYPRWMMSPHLLKRILLRLYIELTGGVFYTVPFFKKKQFFSKAGKEKYYFGSAWFTITSDCAKYIVDFVDRNPEYRKFFANASIPDESFFQTIVFNSPFKETVLDSLNYVDWSNNRRSPSILTMEHYAALVAAPYLVARKFDTQIDSLILDKMDAVRVS